MTKNEVKALRDFLTWMEGFEESVDYPEYQAYCRFTDDQWDSTVETLWRLVHKEELKRAGNAGQGGGLSNDPGGCNSITVPGFQKQ